MDLLQWTLILILFRFAVCDSDLNSDSWDDVHMICPNQCVCQHLSLKELSVARWIDGLRSQNVESKKDDNKLETNEVPDDDVCMLQGVGNFSITSLSLPQDVQALVLLHNGNDASNFTVLSSDLLQIPDLEILEIRGTGTSQNLIFDINEPMPNLKYANFELIQLTANENIIKNHMNTQHPSETYDYVPDSERYAYDVPIEIEEEVQVVPYDVYMQELQRSRRATFIGWDNLEGLRIHSSQLDEVNWEMFDGLVKLKHLSLESNGIKVVPPFAFYGALNIKSLSLARNNILDLHYRSLAGLLRLKYLDLSLNNLTKLSELTFPPFPKLKSIDLRENPIEFIFPMTFAIMNGTNELTLGSQATALDLTTANDAFLNLDHLKELNLLNVNASGSYQTTFRGLKALQRLKLKGSLDRIEYDAFSEMPQLKQLILSDCNIAEISMDAFLGVKELRIVDLSNNQLSFIPPGLFDEQNQLQEIYLQNNNLKELPKGFFSISSLKLVRLTENPWICKCEMSSWNQAITNSIRDGLMKTTSADVCVRNPKTGNVEYCNDTDDEFPQFSYGFDNKMSPLCFKGAKKRKQISVYKALRHALKCGDRAHKKLEFPKKRTNDIDEKSKSSWTSQQRMAKRKAHFEHKLKRTLNKDAKVLKEQIHVNNDVHYP